jgi:hypothetical protein
VHIVLVDRQRRYQRLKEAHFRLGRTFSSPRAIEIHLGGESVLYFSSKGLSINRNISVALENVYRYEDKDNNRLSALRF